MFVMLREEERVVSGINYRLSRVPAVVRYKIYIYILIDSLYIS